MRISKFGGYVDLIFDCYVDGSFLVLLVYVMINELIWYFVVLLVFFGLVMVSYLMERFRGVFCRDVYKEVLVFRKLFGKRDERVFLMMFFLLY